MTGELRNPRYVVRMVTTPKLQQVIFNFPYGRRARPLSA